MVEKLLIYTDDETLGVMPFPQTGEQASINTYTFTEGRMGSVNISDSLMYPRCLDDEWTQREFVEFRGERYWIFDTPTSSKSNTDLRYKHELVFKADRTRLDNTYFFDVVSPDAEDVDQFVSNSTKFTFFGDIHEFVTRMNYSLQYSKMGYSVVIDEGITSEGKLMSFEDKFFSEVLQEVFNVYELPYYYVGRVIHIGFTNNAITHVFKYGYDRELLTISKTNANYRIVNRCTGIGSSENIPNYYPNDTRKGAVKAVAGTENVSIKTEDIQVINNDLYREKVSLEEKVTFSKKSLPVTTQLYINLDEQLPYTQPVSVTPRIEPASSDDFRWIRTSYEYTGLIDLSSDAEVSIKIDIFGTLNYRYYKLKEAFLGLQYAQRPFDQLFFDLYKYDGSNWVLIKATNRTGSTLTLPLGTGTNKIKVVANYSTLLPIYYFFGWSVLDSLVGIGRDSSAEYSLWTYKDNTISLNSIGVYITKTPSIGDYFVQKQVTDAYIITSQNLMPPIYRETMGAERFYNAKNDTYISPETGDYYDFENEYTEGNPKEMIVSFDYIKPTIKGIKNAAGQLLGEIVDVAFDDDDNDEIDPSSNEPEHPYFYIKLRKFDGDYGFNLFDHAIVGGDTTFSITSGNCAACNFVLSVLEETDDAGNQLFKNPVQVDSSGNIVPGGKDDKWNESNIQPQQQNTQSNEIWVRVQKDQDTFGTLMPSNSRNYKPKAGDSFVITNITLPLEYIRNAENELKEAIIKYMAANNSEKFNFSINFKRKFFAEYPNIESLIDANARLQIEYNGQLYELYVSQYTYKVNGTDPLPEITVELSDTITIRKGNVQKSIDAVKQDLMSSIGSIDIVKMGLKYFIRKDVDDFANGNITFRAGIFVTGNLEGEETDFLQEGSEDYILEDNHGDFIQEDSVTKVINAPQTLGSLSNVNSIVDGVATEDVILVKKTGTSEWTQERRIISEGITDAPNDGTLYGRKNRDWVKVPDTPTKLPNPNSITFTGAVNETYDGSSPVTVNIPTGGGGGSITVDDHLDLNSTNPVQNKVVTMNINELMDEVFKLSFRSFTGGGTYEKGASITPYITWNIEIKGEEVVPTSATVNGSTTGVGSGKISYQSPTAITTNKDYKVVCNYNTQSISRTASYTFMLKKYWGVSSSTNLENSDVRAMASTWASRTMSKTTFDCTGGKYIYYIIPVEYYGSGVDFWVNGFRNNDVIISDMLVTNQYNVSETYKVMRLNNIQTGVLEVEFK